MINFSVTQNFKSSRLCLSEYNSNLKIVCAVIITQRTTTATATALLLKHIPSFTDRAACGGTFTTDKRNKH